MPNRYSKYIKLIHGLGDIAAIVISVLICFSLTDVHISKNTYAVSILVSIASWFICANFLGAYHIIRVVRRIKAVFIVLKTIILYILLIEAVLNILNIEYFTRQALLYHYSFLSFLVIAWRISVTTALRIYRAKGYNLRNVVIFGYNQMAKDLAEFFNQHPEYGYRFLGYFYNNEYNNINKEHYLGCVENFYSYAKKYQVDQIYCCPFELEKDGISKLLNFTDDNLIRVKFLPDINSYNYSNLKIDFYDVFPVLVLRSMPLDDAFNKFFKRSFDILFSLAAIILLLSWLLPILALLIRLSSKGPILFKQVRSGINNRSFKCYKLRTMFVNQESNSRLVSKGDSRITPIGAFLRKTSLDELPQFFNVLFGQMSIVGPRPHMLKADEEYAVIAEKYKVRHLVKPGITGLSQVRGYRGDTSHTYQVRGRVRLDIFYLENWSFYLDLKIIFYTVYNIIKGDKHAF